MYTNQLNAALKQGLKPAYLLSSDEVLLLQETRDKICQTAYKAGFLQRELVIVGPDFNWQIIQQHLQTRPLFSEKSIIDLRLPRWEAPISTLLLDYLNAPANDLLLIISIPKITSTQQKTKWFQHIRAVGEAIIIKPIGRYELPQWIQQKLNMMELEADTESIQLLSTWTEGNLLATQQVLEKLQLLYPRQAINSDKMMSILNDNARFTVFDLSNAVLLGNIDRVIHIISHLQLEGVEPTLILWVLVREIRYLIQLLDQKQRGIPINQLLQKEWQSRKVMIKAALQRQNYQKLLQCLQNACKIDHIIKGLQHGSYWNELERLALSMAGS